MTMGIMPGQEIAGMSVDNLCHVLGNAETTLKEFMDRVSIANKCDDFLVRVTEVVLYSSSQQDAPMVGGLDIACRLESKIPASLRFKVYSEHLSKSGRPYSRIGCESVWPFEEVRLFLKNQNHAINLHEMSTFLSMKKNHRFSYQVLLGDPAKVARNLKDYEYLLSLDA